MTDSVMTPIRVFDALIDREGGFVDNPADRGGPTCWGITEKVARQCGYEDDMSAMTRVQAQVIYTKQYWLGPNLHKVAPLSQRVAEELLDTGVNMGSTTAGKFLQRALNVLGTYKLTVDGSIGAGTLDALRDYLARRGVEGEQVLLTMLNAQQSVRYIEIAEANPSQLQFEYGWQRLRVTLALS